MADTKITGLGEMTDPASADLLPIVDASEASNANKNKKVTLTTLFNKLHAGSVGTPTIGWNLDGGNSGFYRSAANEVGVTVSSAYKAAFTESGLKLGTGTEAAQLHLFSDDETDQVIIENSSATAANAPDLVLYRNSASPAVDDSIGNIEFRGEDSGDNTHAYAQITAGIKSPTNGGEDGILDLMSSASGTMASRIRLYGAYTGIGESAPAYPLHVTTALTGTALRLESSADDAASGGDLALFHRRGASSAGQDGDVLSTIFFRGRNDFSTPQEVDYAAIQGKIADASDGTEDGELNFRIETNATLATKLQLTATGASFTDNLTLSGGLTFADSQNVVLNTSTGTKIGTATSQKLALWNATPVVQPSAIANISTSASSGTLPTANGSVTISNASSPTNLELLEYCVELESKLESALAALRSVGIIASS